MTLKDRMVKLRQDNPLFTVAGLTEITLYGDAQERDGDFLGAAAQVLHCSQAEVDEAVAFTGEQQIRRLIEASPEEQALREVKEHIAGLPEDSQIRIEAIACTFRDCLGADPFHAGAALALVGAEQAAK